MNDEEIIAFHERCKRAFDALPAQKRRDLTAQRKLREAARRRYTIDELLTYFSKTERKKAA